MFEWITRWKSASNAFREAFSREASGISRGSNSRPYSDDRALQTLHGFGHAALTLNGNAYASTAKRLFVRSESTITKRFSTRPINKSITRFLGGPTVGRIARQKFIQFGGNVVEVIEPHPILLVLQGCNPLANGFEYEYLRAIDLQTVGNSYLHVVNGIHGMPEEVWRMMPTITKPIAGTDDPIDHYVYGRSPNVDTLEVDEVIQWRMPNPLNPILGRGWYQAAWSALGLADSKREVDLSMFDNYLRPDWLLTTPGANPEAQANFREQFSKQLGGNGTKRGASKVVTTSADVKATALNWQAPTIGTDTRIIEEISAVSGVPVAMLLSNDPTRSSSETARLGWYRNTIQPMCRLDEEKLNQEWVPRFDDSGEMFIAHDPANFEDQVAEANRVSTLVKGGILDPNEGRAELGYPPHKDGDRLYAPTGATGGGSVGNPGDSSDGNAGAEGN